MWLVKWFLIGIVATRSSGFRLPEVLQSFEGNNELLSDFADYFSIKFENEYLRYMFSGIESSQLRRLSKELGYLHSNKSSFLTTPIDELGLADQFVACTACRATVNVISRMFLDQNGELNGPNREEAAKAVVVDICRRVNTETDEVCSSLFDLNWPFLDYIMQNTIMDSRSMCGTLPISFCKVKQKEYDWNLSIDKNDPKPSEVAKTEAPKKGDNDLVVLHLTDIHYDPLYKPGALAECEESLCCQKQNTAGDSKAAGYWSDYRHCDTPWHMITDAFEHIKRTHKKIDMIYQTGDIISHIIWDTSKDKNKEDITKVNDLIKEIFPDTPVYSISGNHEPHPVNVFGPTTAPEQLSVSWLYEHLYSSWSKWLPADTEVTIKAGGYYTTTPRPGFRIIALNNNECYIYNWWIYHSGSNLLPQLQWLHDTLLAAEKSGEFVHILAHIPSGDGTCWTVWSREYNRIIERFRHTISGIFNGHTHFDELNVHYTSKNDAVAVSWNGGSLTSWTKKNPNYKIYHLTPKTMEVVDYETWIFDLMEANKHGADKSPEWFKEYTFSEEFHDDLSPAGLNKLLEKMADNPKLLRKFWRFKHTSAEPRIAEGCDGKCLSKVICRLATTVFDQKDRCVGLQKRLEVALANEDPKNPNDPSTTEKPVTTDKPITTDKPVTTENPNNGGKTLETFQISALIACVYVLKMLY